MNKPFVGPISNVVELLANRFGRELVSIYLVGAVANGEETWLDGKLASDVDLMVVTRSNNPILEKRIADFTKNVTYDIEFEIEVGCTPLNNLKKFKDLEWFECKSSGKLLWGEKALLDSFPIGRSEEIPKWEGIRLLLNRTCEFLRASCGESNLLYAIAKTYLAIGAAYLIFAGRYRCSYKERLHQIQNQCDLNVVQNFRQKYEECSMLKLNQRTGLEVTFDEARIDLLNSIHFFLTKYTGRDRLINDNLDEISVCFNNPSHRYYFFLRQMLNGKMRIQTLFREPCFIVWKEAIDLLEEKTVQTARIANTIQDWRTVLQAYVS